jgi:hypothetical protein
MCCITTLFLVLISRIGIVIWWLANPEVRDTAFQTLVLPGMSPLPAWLCTLVGAIFLPWTTLAYLLVFQGGIVGYEWLVLVVGFLIDIAGHGGSYRHRHRIPVYRRIRRIL